MNIAGTFIRRPVATTLLMTAIVMIDFALEAERKEGKAPLEAILEACSIRFRPRS